MLIGNKVVDRAIQPIEREAGSMIKGSIQKSICLDRRGVVEYPLKPELNPPALVHLRLAAHHDKIGKRDGLGEGKTRVTLELSNLSPGSLFSRLGGECRPDAGFVPRIELKT